MEYVTRGVCGQEGCRERRYFLDNGLWFCRRGHLQEVCRALPSLACSPHCDESQSGEIRLVLICEKLNVCVGPTSRRGSRRFWDSGSEAPSEEGEGGEVAKKYAMSLSLDSWPPSLISAKTAYRGRQAATLFLQSYQLILWKQSHALVHNHGFPKQFEVSVRKSFCCRTAFTKKTWDTLTALARVSFVISGLFGCRLTG